MNSGAGPDKRLMALRLSLVLLAVPLVQYAWAGVLPHQLQGAPLFAVSIDNTFWLFHLSGLAGWLHGTPWAVSGMEWAVLAVAIALFATGKPPLAFIMLLLTVTLSLYMQTWSCTLTKVSAVLPVALFPFCFTGRAFRLAWKLPRYYLAYIMVSAGLFKLINGGLFHPAQLQNILQNQHIDLVLSGSGHFSAKLAHLLSGRFVSKVAYGAMILLELSFVAAIFTRKADRWLAGALVFFCVSIWAVMRIQTLELLLLIVPLLVDLPDNVYLGWRLPRREAHSA